MRHLRTPQAGQNEAQSHGQEKYEDEEQVQVFQKPLTRQEVQELKEKLGGVTFEAFFLKVLMWQAVVGVSMATLAWFASGKVLTAYSAFYGAMCVVLPSALVARTVIKRLRPNVLKHSGGMLLRLFVLELVKILVTVCLLLMAPVLLDSPNWIAIVVSFVVTLKVYWVVALMGSGQAQHVKKLG
jgi:ATP synthase protein I